MAITKYYPDGVTFTLSNLTGAYTDVDDDPESPDGLWLAGGDDGTDTTCTASIAPSGGRPNTGAGLQEIQIWVRQFTTGGTSPTVSVNVRENGTLRVNLIVEASVTSSTGQLITGTWDYSSFTDVEGANVDVEIIGIASGGNPNNRRSVEVGAIAWVADYTVGKRYRYYSTG